MIQRGASISVILIFLHILFYPFPALGRTADRVLVVVNGKSDISVKIGKYYVDLHRIPDENVCTIHTTEKETISRPQYDREIKKPIAGHIIKHNLQDQILYIVLTSGVPLRIQGTGGQMGTRASVDSELALLYREMIYGPYRLEGRVLNPYFQINGLPERDNPFDHRNFDIYLVTRLAGYSWEDIKALIDRAYKPRGEGLFVLDMRGSEDRPGDNWLRKAASILKAEGHQVELDASSKVLLGLKGVIGYGSWGSNDPNRKERHLGFQWAPGAIATTFVSTNARTFRDPGDDWIFKHREGNGTVGSGQSLIGDLIREGVTGASGNVYEPYLDACARPDILFPAYARGYNLAESYYMSLPYVSWQGVVVGDPLCAPFRKEKVVSGEKTPPLYFKQRQFLFAQYLLSRSKDAKAHLVLAEIYIKMGKKDEALRELEEAIRLDPDLSPPYLLLGQIHERDGEGQKAMDVYKRFLRRKEDPLIMNNLAFLYAEKGINLNEALEMAMKAKRALPESAAVMDTLGWVYLKMGNTKEAIQHLEGAVSSSPNDPVIRYHLGLAYLRHGERKMARAELEAALDINESFPMAKHARELLEELR